MELTQELASILKLDLTINEETEKQLVDLIDKCVALRTVNLLNAALDIDPRTVNSFVCQQTICSPDLGQTRLLVSKSGSMYSLNVLGILQGVIGESYILKPISHPVVGINSPTHIAHFEIIQVPTRDIDNGN